MDLYKSNPALRFDTFCIHFPANVLCVCLVSETHNTQHTILLFMQTIFTSDTIRLCWSDYKRMTRVERKETMVSDMFYPKSSPVRKCGNGKGSNV